VKKWRCALLLLALFAAPTRAQNHPASYGQCSSATNCAFGTTGGLVSPGPNQVMAVLLQGIPNSAINGCTDTYGVTWTRFAQGTGLWNNSNLGTTNVPMTAFWAKTGTNSGAETITCTQSPAGNFAYAIFSFTGVDVNVTAANPEDASTFFQDTNANTGTSPTPVTGIYSLANANDIVLTAIGYNSIFDLPNNASSSGPDQESMGTQITAPGGAGAVKAFANIHNFSGASGTIVGLSIQASVKTIFTWSSVVNGAGNAGLYTVALKGGAGLGGSAKRKHPPYIIKNTHQPKPGIIRVSLEDYPR